MNKITNYDILKFLATKPATAVFKISEDTEIRYISLLAKDNTHTFFFRLFSINNYSSGFHLSYNHDNGEMTVNSSKECEHLCNIFIDYIKEQIKLESSPLFKRLDDI